MNETGTALLMLALMVIVYLILSSLWRQWIKENHKEKNKIIELERNIQHLQDTLDHYGIRMSNKMSDENPYYKRWYK